MYTIRAYYLQYCGSYAPHRRRQTPDDGRWSPDAGHRTMDAGPSTPYYKLTGELKMLKIAFISTQCKVLYVAPLKLFAHNLQSDT